VLSWILNCARSAVGIALALERSSDSERQAERISIAKALCFTQLVRKQVRKYKHRKMNILGGIGSVTVCRLRYPYVLTFDSLL